MSAINSIIINDGATTPVAHTYTPVQSGPESWWREVLPTLPSIGWPNIKQSFRPDKGSGLSKNILTLELPVLETATAANASGYTAAPKLAYTVKAQIAFFLPTRATKQQKKDLRVLLANLLGATLVGETVEDFAPPF